MSIVKLTNRKLTSIDFGSFLKTNKSYQLKLINKNYVYAFYAIILFTFTGYPKRSSLTFEKS